MIYDSVKDFEKYVTKAIQPAVAELGNVAESSRKHLQKLVYTNLVDRFDSLLDNFLLDNCLHPLLLDEMTKFLDKPVLEADLYRLVLNPQRESFITDKIRDVLRRTVLRERHSKKLLKVLSLVGKDGDAWNEPKVNVSTGKIAAKIKPQLRTIPYSVCGYADWIYSRRNAVVHGAGNSSFLGNDVLQLQKLFRCTPAKSVKLQLSTITIAAAFYAGIVKIIK